MCVIIVTGVWKLCQRYLTHKPSKQMYVPIAQHRVLSQPHLPIFPTQTATQVNT